jgi:hypothetical protein
MLGATENPLDGNVSQFTLSLEKSKYKEEDLSVLQLTITSGRVLNSDEPVKESPLLSGINEVLRTLTLPSGIENKLPLSSTLTDLDKLPL